MISLSSVRKDFDEYLDSLEDLSGQEKARIRMKLFEVRGCVWKFLVVPRPTGRVLCIGAGWSNTFVFLTEHFQEVTVWDPDPVRLSILKHLAKLLDLSVCFYNGDFNDFFSSPRRFDLVVLENSLSRLPSYRDGSPEQIQARVLRQASELLTSRGQCFICVPNRFAYERWKGETSDYAELPFITLLPRRIAGGYFWLAKKQTYRTCPLSLSGLCRLARQAGFAHQGLYFVHPSSENPGEILGWGNLVPSLKSHPLVRLLNKTRLGKYFQNSLALVVGRDTPEKSFVDQLLQRLQTQLGCSQAMGIDKCLVSETNSVIFFLRVAQTNGAILRLPLDKTSFDRLQNAFQTVQYVKNSGSTSLGRLMSEQLLMDRYLSQPYFVESRMPGIEATALAKSPGDLSRLMAETAETISALGHSCQKIVHVDVPICERYFLSYLRAARPYLPEYGLLLDQITSSLEQSTIGQRLPLLLAHGDLKLGNLLVNPMTKRLCGILDWDMSEIQGLPLIDLLQLISSKYRIRRLWGIGTVLIRVLLPQAFEESERRIIGEYKRKLGLTEGLYRSLSITYWARHSLRNLVESAGSKHPAWMKENIVDVLEYLKCAGA